MIRIIIVLIAVSVGVFFNGEQLSINVVPREPPKEVRKIKPPQPKPMKMDSKLVAKLELLDKLDMPFQEHIENVLIKNRYNCAGMPRKEYASKIASAVLKHCEGDIDLAMWIMSMAYVESSFRLDANPGVSTARGFLQVIYRYHKDLLVKHGITKNDLSSNLTKSIHAGILVFKRYLRIEHGDYVRATERYRGLSVSKRQQKSYLNGILKKKRELKRLIDQYA